MDTNSEVRRAISEMKRNITGKNIFSTESL